jgi:hypothetical protein
MKARIVVTAISLLLLSAVAYATRHHYEQGPGGGLFRINRYTGETCRLFLEIHEQVTKSVNPLDALNPPAPDGLLIKPSAPPDGLLIKPSAPGSSFDTAITAPAPVSSNPLDTIFGNKTPGASYTWTWTECGR